MSKRKLTFEEALKQLEQLAERIERGDIGLEESIAKYEEGMSLVQYCRDVLGKAEHKIQQLQQKPDGSLEVLAFEAEMEEGQQSPTTDEDDTPLA
jgi:exodeoxyribonuclease VII small subunit